MSIPPPPPPPWGRGNPSEELRRAKHFYAIGRIETVEEFERLLDQARVLERIAESEERERHYYATFPRRSNGIGIRGGFGLG